MNTEKIKAARSAYTAGINYAAANLLKFDKYGWEWGGRWTNFKDMPHFQKTFGKTTKTAKMKLKQIDFNAELIGKDGIVVKTMDGIEVKQLTFFKCDVSYKVVGTMDGVLQTWNSIGNYIFSITSDGNCVIARHSTLNLIMYKEVKVMTVDEFYQRYYSTIGAYDFAHKLAAAVKAGEVE
jgi:hypothetical protein